jgi:arylsulfatase A-like enzyme
VGDHPGLPGPFPLPWGSSRKFSAVEKPVHVHDLHATILHLLGFNHEQLTFRYAGREYRLTDVYGKVV